ncbi:dienelactone hydrolase family protein [Hydrogenophaga sp. RWCD_12]|uniref:dienelactone hydrolase family protein n=1 Tax=Hydrogenophaga sp. RWCD_12 TaxID=3391190 RepID=UPI00398482AF
MQRLLSLVLCLAAAGGSAFAQETTTATAWSAAAERPPAVDLREELQKVRVTVKDMYGRAETREIPVTIYRPADDAKHPLVVFNHGRATTDKRAMQGRSRPEQQARWLVKKGFVVMAPTRVGYADNFGDFDPEFSGNCNDRRMEAMHQAPVDQVLAAVELARTLPYVDASRWVVMGQSLGGQTTVATVAANPPGLVGGINFAGGSGGDPERNPGKPCSPHVVGQYWGKLATSAKAPMLWLYWENDLYWGTENPKDWSQAWTKGGGQVEFHQLSPVGKDGHAGFNQDMDHWAPLAEAFLARLGFTTSGLPQRPAASGFAAIDELEKIPFVSAANKEAQYKRFLQASKPRAFAISERGAWGWAGGDWAMGRAIGACERNGQRCRLYAVDDDVVWGAR